MKFNHRYYQIYSLHNVAGKYVEIELSKPFIMFSDNESSFEHIVKSIIASQSDDPSEVDAYTFEFGEIEDNVFEVETFANFKYHKQGVQSEIEGPKFRVRPLEVKSFRAVCKSTRKEFVFHAYDCEEDILCGFVEAMPHSYSSFELNQYTKGVQTSIYNKKTHEQWQILHS